MDGLVSRSGQSVHATRARSEQEALVLSHVHSPTRPSPGLSRLAMRLAASAKSGPAIAARVCPEALRSNLNVVLITSSKEGKPNVESLHVSREFRSVCRAAHSIDSQIEHGRTASSHAGQVDGRIRAPRCTRAIGSAAYSLALRSFGGCGRRPSGRAFPAPTGRDCARATCLPLAHRQLQICVLHRAAKQHRPSHITRTLCLIGQRWF